MINPNEIIEITAIAYLTQLESSYSKHCNINFYVVQGSFKKMYQNKYNVNGYIYSLQPFKAEVI